MRKSFASSRDTSGKRIPAVRLLVFLAAGLAVGAGAGWLLMSTTHAVLELRGPPRPGGAARAALAGRQRDRALPLEEVSDHSFVQTATATDLANRPQLPQAGDTVHVLLTSGGGAYQNFQTRVAYATFLMAQKQAGGERMVAFTRILHRMEDDALMGEVPTFRATPLQPECDGWCDYPVSDRPNAVRQFMDAARDDPAIILAPWLYVTEADYVWVKPLAPPRAEDPKALAQGFPFAYIDPTYPTIEKIMRRYFPAARGPLAAIPRTGPAPALMRVSEWQRVVPRWEALTAAIEADEEAKRKLEWIREMYAFSLALALEDVDIDLRPPPNSALMVQPPADHGLGAAGLMHYTWGSIVSDASGAEIWRFDKREYGEAEHERRPRALPEPPPFEEGWTLQDGVAVTRELRDTLALMMRLMNEGIASLKPLEEEEGT